MCERLTFAVLKAKIIHKGNEIRNRKSKYTNRAEEREKRRTERNPHMLVMYRADWSRRIRHRFRSGKDSRHLPARQTPRFAKSSLQIYKNTKKSIFFSQKICIIRKKVLPLHCQTKTIELWQDLLKRKLN